MALICDGATEPEPNYAAIEADKQRVRAEREAAEAAGSFDVAHWTYHEPAIAEMEKQGERDATRTLARLPRF